MEGPVSMMHGSDPIETDVTTLARGFNPELLARRLVTEEDGGRAVDDARAVAGVVHVLDLLDLRIALHGHRVEPEAFPHLLKRGSQRGEVGDGGAGAHVLVTLEHGDPDDVLHGHD